MPGASKTLAQKEARELRYHALDARLELSADALITQIGHDNTGLTRDTSWNTTSEKVVTGAQTEYTTRGEETMSVDPFYCRKGDPVSLLLQHIDMAELEGDAIKRFYYEAKVDETGETIYAFKKLASVKPTSFGGEAAEADSIPFELALSGKKIPQDFDFATGEFTDVTVTP
jgi:hypothetical protein